MRDEEESSKRNAEEIIEKLKQESKDKVNNCTFFLARYNWPEVASICKLISCHPAVVGGCVTPTTIMKKL